MSATTPEPKVSLVRLNRVEYFLRGETGLVPDNGKTVDYSKGSKHKTFAVEVWNVAHAIDAAGLDACNLNRAQCIAWARHVLLNEARPTDQAAAQAEAPKKPTAVKTPAVISNEGEPAADEDLPDPEVVTETLQSGGSVSVPLPVAVWQLLLGAINLIEMYDKSPGAKDRISEIAKVASVYHSQSGQVSVARVEDDSLEAEASQQQSVSVPSPE